MNYKDLYNNFFSYKPKNNYQFSLSENSKTEQTPNIVQDKSQTKVNIFTNLTDNIEHIKTKYNVLINSDIILREFTINARGKQYNAFLLYIDGMVDSKIMNDFVLTPLMLRNKNNLYDGTQNKIISESVANNVTVRKVKKFDLSNYLMGCLMPQNSVQEISNFDEVSKGVNSRKLCFIY